MGSKFSRSWECIKHHLSSTAIQVHDVGIIDLLEKRLPARVIISDIIAEIVLKPIVPLFGLIPSGRLGPSKKTTQNFGLDDAFGNFGCQARAIVGDVAVVAAGQYMVVLMESLYSTRCQLP